MNFFEQLISPEKNKESEIKEVISSTQNELKSGFEQFIGKVKEIYGSITGSLKNLFDEISGKHKDMKKTEQPVSTTSYVEQNQNFSDKMMEGIDMPKDQFFKHFIEYIQHQQGAGGTSEILKNTLMGIPLSSTVLNNMKNNVSSDFPGGKSNLTAPRFMRYRFKRFTDKYKEYAHKKTDYEDAIEEGARFSGQPKEIIKTIIGIESKGDRYANKGNASSYKGLMQVDIRQIKQYGVTDIYDPKQNIMMAMKLRKQNDKQLVKIEAQLPSFMAQILPESNETATA